MNSLSHLYVVFRRRFAPAGSACLRAPKHGEAEA